MPLIHPVLKEVTLPLDTDYIGIYLTNRCFLSCAYCITNHNERFINTARFKELEPQEWIDALNRLQLPPGIPLTFQGGEPFIYQGIWDLLENIRHKIDILTALPPQVTVESFRRLKTLDWNKRSAPYPTIRVSFHHGQNDYRQLIDRIKSLQEVVSIGLYHIEHPAYPQLTEEIRAYARNQGVEFRTKEFLGEYNGKACSLYKYQDACAGHITRKHVTCRNTVYPIGPDGTIYRCHADLYGVRSEQAIGNILDPELSLEHLYRDCPNYGTCSPCDVKVKTNHLQQFGYTSIDITFDNE